MAPYGFSITKKVSWRGAWEEFSNVYHYDMPGTASTTEFNAVITDIVRKEKVVHSNAVTFVRARAFGPTNVGKILNVMQVVQDLSGTGSLISAGIIPHELAVVCQFYLGRGPKGGKQFLRKYLHVCGLLGINGSSAGGAGNASMPAAETDRFIPFMNDLKTNATGFGDAHLCNPEGKHLPLGSSPVILPVLHTRQFRR